MMVIMLDSCIWISDTRGCYTYIYTLQNRSERGVDVRVAEFSAKEKKIDRIWREAGAFTLIHMHMQCLRLSLLEVVSGCVPAKSNPLLDLASQSDRAVVTRPTPCQSWYFPHHNAPNSDLILLLFPNSRIQDSTLERQNDAELNQLHGKIKSLRHVRYGQHRHWTSWMSGRG